MTYITKNFTLEELTKTNCKANNAPSTEAIINLTKLCLFVLQPLRDAYKMPIMVNSGYRSTVVNRTVGGAATSQHLKGMAADITTGTISGNKQLFELVQKLGLPFDQLIDEKGMRWIHVSYSDLHRRAVIHL